MLFYSIKAGSTSQRIPVQLQTTTASAPPASTLAAASVVASYRLPGAAETSITLSDVAIGAAYTSGGWAPDVSGCYELHLPNAAISSTTAPWVRVRVRDAAANCEEFVVWIRLEQKSLDDNYAVLTDAQTGLASRKIRQFTAPSGSSAGVIVFDSGASGVDGAYPAGSVVTVWRSGVVVGQTIIDSYTGATKSAAVADATLIVIAGDVVLVEAGLAPLTTLSSVDAVNSPVDVSTTSVTGIATKVWTIDFSTIGTSIDAVRRSAGQAIRMLLNKLSITGSTLTVCKEDDSTVAYTATVTPAPGASPISGTDPN